VIVQIGTPVELFERPAHTFVGHFIGSPGMNVLPCEVRDGTASYNGVPVRLEGAVTGSGSRTEIGVRPEFVSLGDSGLPAVVRKVSDLGRYSVVETMLDETRVSAIVEGEPPAQGDTVHLQFRPDQTRLYADGWLASEAGGQSA
jgi:glycerol transport system ATP-binding protein